MKEFIEKMCELLEIEVTSDTKMKFVFDEILLRTKKALDNEYKVSQEFKYYREDVDEF